MTTIEFHAATESVTPRKTARGGWITRLLAHLKRRREERITLQELSEMDARLLRDMGIEPQDLAAALWDINRSALFSPFRHNGD